jgi:hypothetical protein
MTFLLMPLLAVFLSAAFVCGYIIFLTISTLLGSFNIFTVSFVSLLHNSKTKKIIDKDIDPAKIDKKQLEKTNQILEK